MQTSMVFAQRSWPGSVPPGDRDGRDVDDCAAVSAVQLVNTTAPHLPLYGIRRVRAAAGDIDRPDVADGLTTAQVARALRELYPSIAPHIIERRGVRWTRLVADLAAGRPVSVALDSSKLPAPLAFGFRGRHQSTLAPAGAGVLFANPLANPYARWLRIQLDDVRAAVMAFGELVNGHRGAWYVAGPTDAEALAARMPDDATPFDQSDVDAATAELQRRIDAAREALGDG